MIEIIIEMFQATRVFISSSTMFFPTYFGNSNGLSNIISTIVTDTAIYYPAMMLSLIFTPK